MAAYYHIEENWLRINKINSSNSNTDSNLHEFKLASDFYFIAL